MLAEAIHIVGAPLAHTKHAHTCTHVYTEMCMCMKFTHVHACTQMCVCAHMYTHIACACMFCSPSFVSPFMSLPIPNMPAS